MKTANRIQVIAQSSSAKKRSEAYDRLDWSLGYDPEDVLNADEMESLIEFFFLETDKDVLASMWHLILRVPAQEKLKDFCLHWLENPRNAHRGHAVHYLRVRYPDVIDQILKKYENDSDAGVRYGLAKHLQRTDVEKSKLMMIDALIAAEGNHFDILADEIEIVGDEQDVQRLIEMDRERGGGTKLGEVARRLEQKLKGHGG